MSDNTITGLLTERFGEAILGADASSDLPTFTVKREAYHDLIRTLKDDPEFGFGFLTTLCGIHYPDSDLPFGVICHLHNMERNIRIRVKTFLPADDVHIPTLTDLYSAANWMERETYDFYGILFDGHPNLKRILNVEYMDYFPMRKEYPLEDRTREDKDDRFFGR